jgi:hypothetical protein
VTQNDVKISPDKTWVPLSALIGLIMLLLGGITTTVWGAVWISSSFQELTHSNILMTISIKRVEEAVDRVTTGAVTQTNFALWLEVLRARNPDLKIPDLPR